MKKRIEKEEKGKIKKRAKMKKRGKKKKGKKKKRFVKVRKKTKGVVLNANSYKMRIILMKNES